MPKYLPGGPEWKLEEKFYRGDKLIGGFDLYLTLHPDTKISG